MAKIKIATELRGSLGNYYFQNYYSQSQTEPYRYTLEPADYDEKTC